MKQRHRLAALPALGLAATALVAALAAPSALAAESAGGREVVSVTPIVGAPSSEELAEGIASGASRPLVAEDGMLRVVEDADFTSGASTRRLAGGVDTRAARPSAFDLRDATFQTPDGTAVSGSYQTPVKSQDPFGNCWAFGTIAAAESSYLSETGTPYEATVTADQPTGLDLSEKQLTWFTWNPLPADDPSGQGGEGFHTAIDPVEYSGVLFNFGGNFGEVTTLFSSSVGPLAESVDPILQYHNAAGEYEPTDAGFDMPSADGDWSVPEELRYRSSLELEEAFALPSPASWEPTDDPAIQRYVYNPEGVDAVKDQLLAGRGVALGFCADTSLPGQSDPALYLNTETWAQYTYENPNEGAKGGGPNHAACIVGYDDSYAKENFLEGHRPPADGAFIVKNNWGALDASYGNQADWGIDGTGYFYLSYYDKGITSLQAFDFITSADTDVNFEANTVSDNAEVARHQYAYMPGDATNAVYDEMAAMANVYEIAEPSVVRTVATQTYGYGADVRFDIYLLREGATEPTDGKLLWTGERSYTYGGYHRVELERPIVVDAGARLGVVVTTRLPDGSYELMYNTQNSKVYAAASSPDSSAWTWGETVVNPGESFMGSATERIEYNDGTYGYGGYEWDDFGESVAGMRADGEAALEAIGYDELLAARDEAFRTFVALDEGDPGYEEASAALDEAQAALIDTVAAHGDELSGALNVFDNFPIQLTTEAIDPANPPVVETVEMYRLYNPYSGEHLFTGDGVEKATLLTAGWEDEGTGWTAPAESPTPVWRLYNPYTGEHLYTLNPVEREALGDAGWRDEGVAFHSDGVHTTPVYRLYNPADPGLSAHHYTTDVEERDRLVADHGWRSENVAWYGV